MLKLLLTYYNIYFKKIITKPVFFTQVHKFLGSVLPVSGSTVALPLKKLTNTLTAKIARNWLRTHLHLRKEYHQNRKKNH